MQRLLTPRVWKCDIVAHTPHLHIYIGFSCTRAWGFLFTCALFSIHVYVDVDLFYGAKQVENLNPTHFLIFNMIHILYIHMHIDIYNVCKCIYVNMCTYIYSYKYMYMYMYLQICTYIYVYIHIHVYICIYIYMCVWIYKIYI